MARPILFPEIRASEHLLGALHREFGGIAAHDMRDLAYTLLRPQFIDDGHGALIEDLLIYVIMCVGEGRDLRQMGDAEDLMLARQLPELLADYLPTLAANA